MNPFEKILERLKYAGGCDANCEYDNGWDGAIGEAVSIVQEVAEEYNNGWIPCSERLPNKEEYLRDDGIFIVTDGNRRYESIYDIYTNRFQTLHIFPLAKHYGFTEDKNVIAWQPLPEPYQTNGE